MEHQIAINMKRLWELAHEGKSAQEIMQELDISDMATLKNALQGLMQEKGKTINVPGLIGQAAIDPRYNEKGDRIPPAMLEEEDITPGD
jgi:hypothetical protein